MSTWNDKELSRARWSGYVDGGGVVFASFGVQGLWGGEPIIESVNAAIASLIVGALSLLASHFIEPRKKD